MTNWNGLEKSQKINGLERSHVLDNSWWQTEIILKEVKSSLAEYMYQEFNPGSPLGLLAPKSGSPDQSQVALIQYLLA